MASCLINYTRCVRIRLKVFSVTSRDASSARLSPGRAKSWASFDDHVCPFPRLPRPRINAFHVPPSARSRFLKYETQLLLGCLMERLKMCHLLYIRSRRPKRIILMRHAESEGNVDKRIYTSTPDHALKITDRGQQQVSYSVAMRNPFEAPGLG